MLFTFLGRDRLRSEINLFCVLYTGIFCVVTQTDRQKNKEHPHIAITYYIYRILHSLAYSVNSQSYPLRVQLQGIQLGHGTARS